MLKKLTLRLPIEWVKRLEEEAQREKICLSAVVRDKISGSRDSQIISAVKHSDDSLLLQEINLKLADLQASHLKDPSSSSQINPVLLEVLFIVREFLFERNAQALRRIDEKLDRMLGKDRRKIL